MSERSWRKNSPALMRTDSIATALRHRQPHLVMLLLPTLNPVFQTWTSEVDHHVVNVDGEGRATRKTLSIVD